MTTEELANSAATDDAPPAELSPECAALWHTKAGNWEAAHDIAQDIHTSMGSWIHAHLHLIEGDIGNAGYWYSRAGKRPSTRDRIDHGLQATEAEKARQSESVQLRVSESEAPAPWQSLIWEAATLPQHARLAGPNKTHSDESH